MPTDSYKKSKIRMLPILIIQIYLITTLIFYVYGPWAYPTLSDWRVVHFALICQIALTLGYYAGRLIYVPPRYKNVDWRRILRLGLIVNIVMLIPTTVARTGNFLPDVVLGLTSPGEAYARSAELSGNGFGVVIEYLRIVLGPLLFSYLPLSIYYWSALKNFEKAASLIIITYTLALYISMGTNKAIGEFAALIPVIGLISLYTRSIKISSKQRWGIVVIALALISGFFSFMSVSTESRSGSGIKAGFFSPGNTTVNSQNALLLATPPAMRNGLLAITSYSGQGYFAIGLALDEEFTPMYGLGSSTFVSRQVTKFLGRPDFEDRSYPAKIEKYGWDRYKYWSTIYLWLASDVSFYGVPFLCFFIGFLLFYVWNDLLLTQSPQSIVLFSMLIVMILYFSANNQIGQSGELLFAFMSMLGLWLIGRSKTTVGLPGGLKI